MIEGSLLKYFRKKRGFTQEQLSKGVCSISYLSKVENGQLNPSEEILNCLCIKLDITLGMISKSDEDSILTLINDWYLSIKYKLNTESLTMREKLLNIIDQNTPRIYLYFKLVEIRYYLMQRHFENANENIRLVQSFRDVLTINERFLLEYFIGLNYYLQNSLVDAQTHFNNANAYENIQIYKDGDFYLHLSMLFSKLLNSVLAIIYANKALHDFEKNINYEKCLDCQLILSINLYKIGLHQNSINILKKALNVVTKNNDKLLMGVIYHNLGMVYSDLNLHEEAISVFKKSLKYGLKSIDSKINTLFHLGKELISINKIKKSNPIMQELTNYVKKSNSKKNNIYLELLKYELNGIKEELFGDFLLKSIQYFKDTKDIVSFMEFAKYAARYYESINHYKKANTFNKFLSHKNNITEVKIHI